MSREKNLQISIRKYASGWVKDVVEEELRSCHLEKSVKTSKMNDDALFFPSRKQLRELLSQIKEGANRPLAVEQLYDKYELIKPQQI